MRDHRAAGRLARAGRSGIGTAVRRLASPWKLLGLAGLAGVAASGVVVARAERRRRAYTPDEVRARLHERSARAASNGRPDAEPAGPRTRR